MKFYITHHLLTLVIYNSVSRTYSINPNRNFSRLPFARLSTCHMQRSQLTIRTGNEYIQAIRGQRLAYLKHIYPVHLQYNDHLKSARLQ